jgi:hypothetical protein
MAEARLKESQNKSEPSLTLDQSSTTTQQTTNDTSFLPIGEEPGKPSVQEEIFELKERYDAGELPNEKPEREARAAVKEEKKRRTKKEIESEAARMEAFTGSLELLSKVAAALVCSALPNPLPPADLEVKILNDSLSAVAQKHFDKLLDYDAELSLTIAVCAIIIPRLKRPQSEKPKEAMNLKETAEAAKDAKFTEVKQEEKNEAAKPQGMGDSSLGLEPQKQ